MWHRVQKITFRFTPVQPLQKIMHPEAAVHRAVRHPVEHPQEAALTAAVQVQAAGRQAVHGQAQAVREAVPMTGGEPLLREGMAELITAILSDPQRRVEIETNGSVDIAEFKALGGNVSYTLDYKCPSSGMENDMCLANYNYIDKNDSVKFVVGSQEDLEKCFEIVREYALDEKTRVFISPVYGSIDPADIVDFMIENDMNDVKLQLQLHKFIWDPEERGV